jgi:hypothetical protein
LRESPFPVALIDLNGLDSGSTAAFVAFRSSVPHGPIIFQATAMKNIEVFSTDWLLTAFSDATGAGQRSAGGVAA